jgi:hypothetical protein
MTTSAGWPLFLTTLGVLVLELSLTRLFSVVLFYHYAFLVISVALLGLAVGALVARFAGTKLPPERRSAVVAAVAMFAAVTLLPALIIILRTNLWLVTSAAAFGRLATLFLICLIPFALAGFIVATVMASGPRIATLYFYDLLGAGAGCLLFVPLIETLGAPNAMLSAGTFWCLAAMMWSAKSRSVFLASGLVLCGLVGLLLVNLRTDFVDVRYTRGAPRKNELFSAWNLFSRVSVHRDARGQLWIEIDGGAGTVIPDVDERVMQSRLGATGPEVGFTMVRPEKSLVIGPGGGIDILRALLAGSKQVTAVEINPIIVRDVMLGKFEKASNFLYSRPGVQVHVEDGRSFIERTGDRYDVIQLSQVDTWAVSASGAYALTESYLYTVDAVEAYLRSLTPQGVLSITRWEFPRPRETLRLVSIYLAALERIGVEDPRDHLIVVLDQAAAPDGPRFGTVIARPTPFDATTVAALRDRSRDYPLEFAYLPLERTGIAPFTDLILANDRDSFFTRYPFNVRPVTDDRPFFFFTSRWRNFHRGIFAFDPLGDSLNTGAQFLLLGILLLALVTVLAFLILPLWLMRSTVVVRRGNLATLLFCIFVGLGYIMIEIALIQRFTIYLGQPVYSLTAVVALLLVASGLGSRFSNRFDDSSLRRRAKQLTLVVALLFIAEAIGLEFVVRATQSAGMPSKFAVVFAFIVPLGFLMGMPFPTMLRKMAASSDGAVEWGWALNAAATVLGSALTVFLAVVAGLSVAMLAAAAMYVLASSAA